ncbi:cation diffusion facilitator family transporter [Geotalea uraniireducens]|uniref:Cation diffusion facilitator family transporter n=1 Tax=Geotalea uraniireducens (strain Rf4) TaxID=351605 RepID=A5G746_GEOUR|nr:cation diffusion facilitator family transporter [Geotalea uraniireducens]ABQ27614.1 cation diffusion facilitator family transporter [Geotalea uraniireducens Rf4]
MIGFFGILSGGGAVNSAPAAANEGKRLAVYSLGLNLSLTIAKYFLYLLTSSTALLAETVHSLSDVVGSLLVLGGISLAGIKSAKFPWGLYKAENLAALLSAGLIFISAYEIAKTIIHPSLGGLKHLDVTIAILFLMTLPIFFFFRYERERARSLNSPSLLADAENWRTDLAPLAVVTAGIAGARLTYPFLDRAAAFVVLLLVLKVGYEIARNSIRSLLDASVGEATLDEMTGIVRGFHEVSEIVSIVARNSGRFVFVGIEVRLSLKRLKEAHEVVDRMEREIRQRIPFVEKVTIHYEPERKEWLRFAVPLANRDGEISAHFGAAPFVALWDKRITDGAVLYREIVENPFVAMDKGKGIKLAEYLVGKGVDVLYSRENFNGKGPEYVFSDAEMEVKTIGSDTLQNLVDVTVKQP